MKYSVWQYLRTTDQQPWKWFGEYYQRDRADPLRADLEPHIVWLLHNRFLDVAPNNYIVFTDKIERVTVAELEELV